MPDNRIDLKQLEELAAKATPGPYRACGADRGGCQCGFVWSEPADAPILTTNTDSEDEGIKSATKRKIADAAYLASLSPEVVQQMIAAIRATNTAFIEICATGFPRDKYGRYDKNAEWEFDEACPRKPDAACIKTAHKILDTALANFRFAGE